MATRIVDPQIRSVSAFVSPQSAQYTTVTDQSGKNIELQKYQAKRERTTFYSKILFPQQALKLKSREIKRW